ncbi:hypothetical protein [Ulvibacterium marinum]|uniref:Aldose 1-epimerase n=1 Tax=Ulvibacterium marinum TaxID=2419782 RepID=A0A3B0CBC4_9FLAO|nr:hypothetical protein [Ulvibacterium marinum]RKN83322.1 hypothetical protein D7Z94_05715 [Ulvibacterium marinum]
MENLKNWLSSMFYLFFLGSISQEIPQAQISNGLIKATIYLPDEHKGYYRGTRFDWSGVMPVLEHGGHSYFGKWFKTYDPKVHESVMGPVEEFGPVGYDKTKIGDSFLKIGIGTLRKPVEPRYSNFKTYEIHDAGEWEVESLTNQTSFKHILNDRPYSYEYQKVISLSPDTSEMVITHSLTNHGDDRIETEVYNHNFFFLDGLNIGPGYVVRFPFKIVGKGKINDIGKFVKIEDDEIVFIKKLGKKDHVYIGEITGFDNNNSNGYEIWVENRRSGAGVKITCDRPLSRLVFWSAQKTVCPEPYIDLEIAPGATVNWTIKYDFYKL